MQKFRFDFGLVLAVILLLVFGLIMMASVSVSESHEVTRGEAMQTIYKQMMQESAALYSQAESKAKTSPKTALLLLSRSEELAIGLEKDESHTTEIGRLKEDIKKLRTTILTASPEPVLEHTAATMTGSFWGSISDDTNANYYDVRLKELSDELLKPRNDFYLSRHFINVAIGIPLLILGACVSYQLWFRLAPLLYYLSLLLMAILFVPGLGVTYKGATGWLDIPLLPSIQPVEIMKISLILYLARMFQLKSRAEIGTFHMGFIPFALTVGAVLICLAMQPDFGSILVLIPVSVALFYIAGASVKQLVTSFMVALFIFSLAAFQLPYIHNRVSVFFSSEADPTSKNVGWQIQQSLIAVGSGGVTGLGIGKSIQKFGYLPEVQGDTIFAAIGEETGFVGTLLVIILFFYIGYRGTQIARAAPDLFGYYAALGIVLLLVWQACVNIGVTLKVLPLTGITLPLMSYGGSSLITMLFALGILINISRHARQQTKTRFSFYRRRVRGTRAA